LVRANNYTAKIVRGKEHVTGVVNVWLQIRRLANTRSYKQPHRENGETKGAWNRSWKRLTGDTGKRSEWESSLRKGDLVVQPD